MISDKSLGIVCCYFNPCGFKSKYNNFISFYNHIRRQTKNILVVEIESDLSLPDEVESLKLKTDSVLWHKENLLNIGIEKLLKDGYENIAWLDADIFFQDGFWFKDTISCLKNYNLCQMFSKAFRRSSSTSGSLNPGCVRYWEGTGNIYPLGTFFHTGYAWAARSECLSECLLYDKAIIGGGDSLIWLGSFHSNKEIYQLFQHHPIFKLELNAYIMDFLDWSEQWGHQIQGKVSCVYNNITALPHGFNDDRNYVSRYFLLNKHNYNPKKDVEYIDGLLHCKNKNLSNDIHQYFKERKEDRLSFLHGISNFIQIKKQEEELKKIDKKFKKF